MDIIEHLGIESVPVIAVIVFLVVQAVKAMQALYVGT